VATTSVEVSGSVVEAPSPLGAAELVTGALNALTGIGRPAASMVTLATTMRPNVQRCARLAWLESAGAGRAEARVVCHSIDVALLSAARLAS
jgi:hypothetical protein